MGVTPYAGQIAMKAPLRVALLWLALSLPPTAPWAQPMGAPPARDGLAKTAPRAALERQDLRAQLLPRRQTTLAAEIGAKINRLTVPEGGAFKAGQLLVSFDCTLQAAQRQKALTELQGAEQTLKSNQRLAELNSIGQLDLEQSKTAVGKARADLAATDALLSKCSISAPYSGRVAEQRAREQQFVQPGQALLDILDDSALDLEFLVPSRWLAWLRVGASFQILIDETGRPYPAKIQRLGARVDPVSQSVKVSAVIEGRHSELVAGMSGVVQIGPPN